ncbi:uncharacterized protein LOC131314096 [Rhododendron vialii]|uniref:uncharacterized protein LOC131314096 n=1 Tax=Rhododendron vialii TaxID=182163 RepID=UPI00265EE4D5|nr:uncharacterized protein LOC131314096 [Rhododendron vialii]
MATREIVARTPPTLIPNIAILDSVRWILTKDGKFSANSAWQALRAALPMVPWAKSVWFPHHVPRWAFIEWITFMGCLSTKDRLLSWGMGIDANCVLCLGAMESHEHLFFERPFSKEVWKMVLTKNQTARIVFGAG